MRNILAVLFLTASLGYAGGKLSKDRKIVHALNRLTFGARPGDFERVRQMGLKKWIDLQLHPERIAENPLLVSRLRPLDSLEMSPAQLVTNYPPPQIVKAMVAGKIPFPSDPDKRMMIRKLALRYQRKQGGDAPPAPAISQLLSPGQIRVFKMGTPREKLTLFLSLPKEKQDDLLEAMPAGVRNQLFLAAPADLRRRIEELNGPEQVIAQDLSEAKLLRAIYSNRQLQEVLVDFWYNHFNVFLDKGADRYLVTSYERDVIRPRVLGKFKDLLVATAQSPAMLYYLDNWQSRVADPRRKRPGRGLNENYGRELLELHSLGVDGGYTQKDVIEVARCFTGWTIRDPGRGGSFEFNPKMHDAGEKTVLGVRIPAGGGIEDGMKVLDIVAHHPSTARFISRKLAMRFVADDPPASLVNRMARTFLNRDGDIREVLKTMIDSPEFWSAQAYQDKMKSPLEMVASAVRALDADVDFGFALSNQIAQLGEPLYRKLEPTGYSNSGKQWLNSAALLGRMNFAMALASNRIPGVHVDPARAGAALPPLVSPQESAAITRQVLEENRALAAGLTLGSPEFQKR